MPPRPWRVLSHFARSSLFPATIIAASTAAWLDLAPLVLAHGDAVAPPTPFDLVAGWSFDPTLQLPIALAALAYVWSFRHVNAVHAANPVPTRRLVFWLLGLAAAEIALQSPIDRYESVLFTDHMVQHMILIFAVAPLLVAAAPITLILRVARPEQRKSIVLPILHSRVVRAISYPVVAWVLFAGTMWATHFSPIFEWSLENDFVHDGEHLLYLVTAMLFWWPVLGTDPTPWRMPYVARIIYVFLQMPQNSFLGLAIYSATSVLYPHYTTIERTWGPAPLADQQLAGGVMWVGGDLLFLLATLSLAYAWSVYEEKQAVIVDARLDREMAARRRAGEVASSAYDPGSGAAR